MPIMQIERGFRNIVHRIEHLWNPHPVKDANHIAIGIQRPHAKLCTLHIPEGVVEDPPQDFFSIPLPPMKTVDGDAKFPASGGFPVLSPWIQSTTPNNDVRRGAGFNDKV